ncbi:FAD-dependent oxidoreductase [Oricola sp.]|uniref:FAD-dependent oxidoreductase n=1 Tax=Oricola sp. TaxID=1979950 RepID=UPI0025E0D87F|nr:FAD-dependent oxidoreductase [Oricola sp.]MCI5076491.1 FAD-dependent oxidoreductase [Oricola sp.]
MAREGTPADCHCDVLVIGSGAGGLAAAVTAAFHGLRVIVAEKEDVIGGTTAWSGGWLWIPRNPLAVEAGIVEDEDAPLAYLRSEIGNRVDDPRLHVFLKNGPDMVSFFRDNTDVDWIGGNTIPDFHDTPGAAKGGRSVTAAPYDGRRLGEWIWKLRPPLDLASVAGMGIAGGPDMNHFLNATRKPASLAYALRRFARHFWTRFRHGRGMDLVAGNALVARLLRSALDLGVEFRCGAPATGLQSRDGTVTGAVCGGETIRASRGVILATGGFPHDTQRIAAMFEHAPDGTEHHSAAPRSNTGDGLRMAENAGARVADDLVSPGAWAPVSIVTRRHGEPGHFPHLIERAKPGIIAVNASGQRFVNEANSYHDFMRALFKSDPGTTTPHAWIIADHRAQRRYGLGWAKPFPFPLRPYLKSGYLLRGATLAQLAGQCGLPADALEETVARFNAHAETGDDPDFGRGRSPYNDMQGDADHRPNPALGALRNGPYYAVKVVPGSLGTFAGLRTDGAARVLGAAGAPIGGLYAVGNDMASVMGGNYPSGGITLGPAMTFGYVAGRVLAGLPVTGLDTAETQIERTDA